MQQLRIRKAVALVDAAALPVLPVVVALLVGVFAGPPVTVPAVVFASVLVLAIPLSYRRVRRRTLTVSNEGLEVQRDQYRLRVSWDDVTGTALRRHQLLFNVDELHVRNAQVLALDANGRATTPPDRLAGHPATTRIQVSLFDAHWRTGPIGKYLRQFEALEAS